MQQNPAKLARRSIGEWTVSSPQDYGNPFVDIEVTGEFSAPSGSVFSVPGFYDGDGLWRVRFNPGEAGEWQYHITAQVDDPALNSAGTFTVTEADVPGFVRSTPGEAWGFRYENGEPIFFFGDTVYNLFGAAFCALDVDSFLERRAEQGFNLLRVRLQVSRYHPPVGFSEWQTRPTWPWGGSEQAPELDTFNLEWFRTVDAVMQKAESLGIHFEMVMQAWGFEYPFNDRSVFTAEYEDLWVRYLVARYDAFNSAAFWTLMNEYEYYPEGRMNHSKLSDMWGVRIGRRVKELSAHNTLVALHNGPQHPPPAQRFAFAPGVIDVWMFQEWGAHDEKYGWLAPNITKRIGEVLGDWPGSVILSEYAYERDDSLPRTFHVFDHTGPEHNRRGAWQGVFAGVGVVTGFDSTWGPNMILDRDQAGMAYLQIMHRFVRQTVNWPEMQPAQSLIVTREYDLGRSPLVLANANQSAWAVYLPAGGDVTLMLDAGAVQGALWLDPRTGETSEANPSAIADDGLVFSAPEVGPDADRPFDWVVFKV